MSAELELLAINTIRTLAMDAVQQANSGHPGAPMALAPVAYTLFNRVMMYDPTEPNWPNRDRFVLSNGHASMLLYALLHLSGVESTDGKKAVTLEEIRRFRQLGSVTPGHPEYHLTSGVETTTGPLGQGIGNAVGMAIAQKWIAATFGKPGFEALFTHRIYCVCGDGCLMEGLAAEACSLAGHLKLDNLCLLYDDNSITIDGRTNLAFTENVAERFMAYGWQVRRVTDANDTRQLLEALRQAHEVPGKPTIVMVKSIIGYGAPKKQDTEHAHGEPLGEDECRAAKRHYGWPEDAKFLVPEGVYQLFRDGVRARGLAARKCWEEQFAAYERQHPREAERFRLMQRRGLPDGWEQSLPVFPADRKGLATRESSGKVLNAVGQAIPWLVGGSADLAKSNKSRLTFEGAGDFQAGHYAGRNLHFGVREHAMGAIINGMALSKLRSYGAGFLIFSDYGRAAIRLSSINELPIFYIFTHDSIGVGEDGPTHQPVEHLASLRAIPGMIVIRPADANEVSEAYRVALQQTHHPVLLVLSRQAVPTFDRTQYAAAAGLRHGGYVMADAAAGTPEIILIASGSEVHLCADVYERLKADGINARLVSLPSWELFEQQPRQYRDQVLPPTVTCRLCVEMASTFGWERYAGAGGRIVGINTFGASAPIKDLMKHFGFTADAIYQHAKQMLASKDLVA